MNGNADSLTAETVQCIQTVGGVSVIVLGGSHARRNVTPSSDIDLGIYYDPSRLRDNEEYMLNEKGALAIASRFALASIEPRTRAEASFSQLQCAESSMEPRRKRRKTFYSA